MTNHLVQPTPLDVQPTPPYYSGGGGLVLAVLLPDGTTTVAVDLLPPAVVDALRAQTDPALFEEVPAGV